MISKPFHCLLLFVAGAILLQAQQPLFNSSANGEVQPGFAGTFRSLDEALRTPAAVAELDLSGQNIASLPAEVGAFLNLKTLRLRNTGLKTLPAELGKCTELSDVDVAGNAIRAVPVVLKELKKLKALTLSFNNQLTLDERSFNGLTNLKVLELQQCNLKTLPMSIGSCLSLTVLNISENEIKELPEGIENLKQLESVIASSNQFTSISKRLLKHQQLRTIDFSNNKITRLMRDVFEMASLDTLIVRSNSISQFPDSLSTSKLRFLDLDSNKLKLLPASVGKLTGLVELHVSANFLTTLPREIGACSNLVVLDASGNDLVDLPVRELASLPGLSTFRIANRQPLPEPDGTIKSKKP